MVLPLPDLTRLSISGKYDFLTKIATHEISGRVPVQWCSNFCCKSNRRSPKSCFRNICRNEIASESFREVRTILELTCWWCCTNPSISELGSGFHPFAWARESVLYWQPTGPNSPYHLDDFGRPALRHGSLNSLFHAASHDIYHCLSLFRPANSRGTRRSLWVQSLGFRG